MRGRELAEQQLKSAIQSLLLAAGQPVRIRDLASLLELSRSEVRNAVRDLQTGMQGGIRLQIHRDEVQLVSAPENAEMVLRFMGMEAPTPLSPAALEVLTVVARQQPTTRSEVEAARGVNSDATIQGLMARGLLTELGRRRAPGRPIEYGTTFRFLEYFGLRSLQDLEGLTPS